MKNWFSLYIVSFGITFILGIILILEIFNIFNCNIIESLSKNASYIKDFYNMLVGGYFAVLSIILAIFGVLIAIKDEIQNIKDDDANLADTIFAKFQLVLPTLIVIGTIVFIGDIYLSFFAEISLAGNFTQGVNDYLVLTLSMIPLIYLFVVLESLLYILSIFGKLIKSALNTKKITK